MEIDAFSQENLKLPPQSVEAEQSVLGAVLLDNNAFDLIAGLIGERDFYRHDHRLIWRALVKLLQKGAPADVVLVAEELENMGELATVGGLPYVGALAQNTPSSANIIHYARVVRDKALQRNLLDVLLDAEKLIFDPGGRTTEQLMDVIEQRVLAVRQQAEKGGETVVHIQVPVDQVIAKVQELADRNDPNGITGLSTGFIDLDHKTKGLQPGDLIIVAGRPSMGKTAFSLNIAENAALQSDAAVLVYTMEMPSTLLAMRLLGSNGRIDQQKLRSGQLDDDDWESLVEAQARLNLSNIYVDETPALTPMEIRSRSRRWYRKLKGKVGVIVVDYLQLMESTGSSETRALEVSRITRALKALAKELNVPVIALSQLNRSLELRPNKRPIMSDLRESGAVEQDADVILFIYRDEVYNESTPDKGIAEIIIGKQRNGPIGTARLTYRGEFTRFENYTMGSTRS